MFYSLPPQEKCAAEKSLSNSSANPSSGGSLKHRLLVPSPEALIQYLIICIPNTFPDDAGATGPKDTLEEPLR